MKQSWLILVNPLQNIYEIKPTQVNKTGKRKISKSQKEKIPLERRVVKTSKSLFQKVLSF